jgi:anti-sigma factor RsiW
MKDCHEIAPLLAALADDQGLTPEPEVARHLAECGSCQRSLRLQREMHGLLRARASTLQERAPDALRERLAGRVGARRPASRRWLPLRMPVAATLLLALLGVGVYGLTSASSRVLAAQLALDHLKCVQLVSGTAALNPAQAARDWAAQYHWSPKVPAAPRARKGSLVGVRRCLYGHGHLAHLLYDVDGRVVSLFVMPRSEYPAGEAPATHEFLGQHAEVWASGDQSFAIVGDVAPEMLSSLAEEFRAAE